MKFALPHGTVRYSLNCLRDELLKKVTRERAMSFKTDFSVMAQHSRFSNTKEFGVKKSAVPYN
jgi:hypothetical protein